MPPRPLQVLTVIILYAATEAATVTDAEQARVTDGCKNNCTRHGLCVYDQCVCQPGWSGASCEVKGQAPVRCGSSSTHCPSIAQCCFNRYSPSNLGCHPSKDYGTNISQGCGDNQPVNQCCKPGPAKPMSTKLPNCIILGDSVSIGYNGIVTELLAKECQVQHAPWDTSDGGAGSTGSAVACLDNYLVTEAGVPYKADAILFNFGLHDMVPHSNLSTHSTPRCTNVYMDQLSNITDRLMATGSKLGFLTTTPFMPLRLRNDTVVEDMNAKATAAFAERKIPVFDLYKTVTDHCGPVYKDCDICRAHPCSYHYNPQGETMQAHVVADAFRSLLANASSL